VFGSFPLVVADFGAVLGRPGAVRPCLRV